jgi:hypothetical protein
MARRRAWERLRKTTHYTHSLGRQSHHMSWEGHREEPPRKQVNHISEELRRHEDPQTDAFLGIQTRAHKPRV